MSPSVLNVGTHGPYNRSVNSLSLPRWAKTAVFVLLALAVLLVIFRLGSQASAGVSLSDPVVWVEDGARGRLLQINGSTREITAQVDVGEDGDSIVALPRGRDAVFLNRTTGVKVRRNRRSGFASCGLSRRRVGRCVHRRF